MATQLNPSDLPVIQLTTQQANARDQLRVWLSQHLSASGGFDPSIPQTFRIFGYAGTGKTTILVELMRQFPGIQRCNCAFTGKAAYVMTRKGTPATTIHKAVYKPVYPDKASWEELKTKLEETPKSEKELRAELKQQLKDAQQVRYVLNPDGSAGVADVIVLDEVSMVGPELGEDLVSFKRPIIVLGDPGQLPPIEGGGYFTENVTPDVMLTEILRQAADNPIIDFATRARQGAQFPIGVFKDHVVSLTTDMFRDAALSSVDQVLCGMNKTRQELNRKIRAQLGYTDPFPMVGERLICLRNRLETDLAYRDSGEDGNDGQQEDYEPLRMQIMNGEQFIVRDRGDLYADCIRLTLQSEFKSGDEGLITFDVNTAHFRDYGAPGFVKSLSFWDLQRFAEFDWAYAITVHKAQGSQWDSVLLYDDKMFRWGDKYRADRRKWLYTGVTRAAENLVIVNS